MRLKCENCGISYESKYRVCPECGTVRPSMPFYSKVLAAAAGGFVILTLILWPLGVFNFSEAKEDDNLAGYTDSDPVAGEADPLKTEPEERSQSADSPELPGEGEKLVIKTIYNNDGYDERGFTWYLDMQTLHLEVCYASGKALDGALSPEWESSNPSVFTVDSNGVLTAVAVGNGKLTVKYGSLSESIPIYISNSPDEYKSLTDNSSENKE